MDGVFQYRAKPPAAVFCQNLACRRRSVCPKQDWEAALKKAQTAYYGSKVSKGQKDYTEVALVFGNASQNPLEQPLFENLARLLADTLAAAEKREGTGEA
ncbi:putative exodeoxyribonuclease V [Neisseria gonorrhoeae]|uniref:Putative exodeoxyribonuclease V n=1 Tax=Neisseria gonorrhoeae TaxID=485 RepID=A0A378VTN9_NEIGO|nr:putative exodeoxyribonuclease V [Neisseria gonorrhoeae]